MYLPSWLLIIVGLGIFGVLNLVTYIIAAALGHVRALFPFISFTGIYAPENGIFVINFAMTSFFLFFVVYARYLHAKKTIKRSLTFQIFNFVVLVIGVSGLFTNLCIAAFESDDAYWPHYLSAILTIFLNYAYAIAQTFIGICIPPHKRAWKWVIFGLQLFMTIGGFFVFLYFVISGYVYPTTVYVAYRDNFTEIENMTELVYYYNQGLNIDYSRGFFEWVLLVEILAFYSTFIPDFHRINVHLDVELRFEEDKQEEFPKAQSSKPL